MHIHPRVIQVQPRPLPDLPHAHARTRVTRLRRTSREKKSQTFQHQFPNKLILNRSTTFKTGLEI